MGLCCIQPLPMQKPKRARRRSCRRTAVPAPEPHEKAAGSLVFQIREDCYFHCNCPTYSSVLFKFTSRARTLSSACGQLRVRALIRRWRSSPNIPRIHFGQWQPPVMDISVVARRIVARVNRSHKLNLCLYRTRLFSGQNKKLHYARKIMTESASVCTHA